MKKQFRNYLVLVLILTLGAVGSSVFRKKNIDVGGGYGDTTRGVVGGISLEDGGDGSFDGNLIVDEHIGVGTATPLTKAHFDSNTPWTTAAGAETGVDTLFLTNNSAGSAANIHGPSIAFGGPGIDTRLAAIVYRQGASANNVGGLVLYISPTGGEALVGMLNIRGLGGSRALVAFNESELDMDFNIATLGNSSAFFVDGITGNITMSVDASVLGGDFIVGPAGAGNIGTTDNPNQLQFLTTTLMLIEGSLIIEGDTKWTGEGSGVPFGHMYVDGTQPIIVALTVSTPSEVMDDGSTSAGDGWLTGEVNEQTFSVEANAIHYITVDVAGKYEINWDLSFMSDTPAANQQFHGGIAIDGTPVMEKGEGHRTINNNADTGNMGANLIYDIAATEEISLWIENTTDNGDANVIHGNIVLSMVGGT